MAVLGEHGGYPALADEAEARVAGNLHVVVRHSQDHYSPVQCTDQGLPWGRQSKRTSTEVEVKVEVEV